MPCGPSGRRRDVGLPRSARAAPAPPRSPGGVVPARVRRPSLSVPVHAVLLGVCPRGPARPRHRSWRVAHGAPAEPVPPVRPVRLGPRAAPPAGLHPSVRRRSPPPRRPDEGSLMFELPAWLLAWFYSITNNYALAISLIAVVVMLII